MTKISASAGQRMTGNTIVRPIRPRALRAWRWPALALILVIAAAALGVPALVLGYLSLSGLLAPTEVDRIWSVGGEGVWQHGLNSLWLAAVAASIATVLAVAPAVVSTRRPGLTSTLLLAVGRSPNALPGIIIGLSLILLFNQLTPVIYGTVLALAIGFAFRLLPQTITTNESALRAVPPNIEQAARTLGASSFMALLRVTVPVALPGISASWMLAFIAAMKELPTAILLRPAGFDTLPVRIWSAASESVYTQAAPPAFLLIVFTMIPLALLYSRRRISRTVDVQV
jgi:iron(III) transport system permease protein